MANLQQNIEKKIKENLNPEILNIINNSHLHKGHMGDNGTNETHFKIEIRSSNLDNLNRIQAHRKINSLLREEFDQGLHALEIKII